MDTGLIEFNRDDARMILCIRQLFLYFLLLENGLATPMEVESCYPGGVPVEWTVVLDYLLFNYLHNILDFPKSCLKATVTLDIQL